MHRNTRFFKDFLKDTIKEESKNQKTNSNEDGTILAKGLGHKVTLTKKNKNE